MTATFATVPSAHVTPIVREDDLRQHIEDERCYSAIRNGKLISELTWNELTDDERRAAYEVMFCIY